jgi:hypothetical protein
VRDELVISFFVVTFFIKKVTIKAIGKQPHLPCSHLLLKEKKKGCDYCDIILSHLDLTMVLLYPEQ